jgi:hypothetical protein
VYSKRSDGGLERSNSLRLSESESESGGEDVLIFSICEGGDILHIHFRTRPGIATKLAVKAPLAVREYNVHIRAPSMTSRSFHNPQAAAIFRLTSSHFTSLAAPLFTMPPINGIVWQTAFKSESLTARTADARDYKGSRVFRRNATLDKSAQFLRDQCDRQLGTYP